MTELFNTPFETSLRVLLLLETEARTDFSINMIACVDFAALYGKSFDISEMNLHGDNLFKFSEFATRKELTRDGMAFLVRRGQDALGGRIGFFSPKLGALALSNGCVAMAQGAKTVFVSIGNTSNHPGNAAQQAKHREGHYTRKPLRRRARGHGKAPPVPVQFFLGASRHIVAQVL